jgi:hypothetical protein
MKKILIVFLFIILSYIAFVFVFLSDSAERPVLAIVTVDSYPFVPSIIAKYYLSVTNYSAAKERVDGASSYSLLMAGYDLGGFKNNEIIWLSDKFIAHGANVNDYYFGYTPIQSAILANSPDLVEYLLTKGADTQMLTQSKTAEHCNSLNALEFAKCINSLGKIDVSKIVDILKNEKT